MRARLRRIALVGSLGDERRVVHTAGYPIDPDAMLPTPDVVLMVDRGADGCMLFRYTAHGELCGDTPHDNASQAESQAMLEYGDALGPWIDVTDAVDAHEFAVRFAAEQLNQRD